MSSWEAIGGAKSGVEVDEAAIDNAGAGVPWDHLRARPADGTLVASGATGMVYEIAGGAPLYVSNWAAIGGARSVTEIDEWDIENPANPASHLSAVPTDGTLVASGATGMVYEIAGGAPLYVSSWAAIGGARTATEIDQWDLDNITNPAAHLEPVPTNGTLIASGANGMVYEIAGGAPLYVSNWPAIGGPRSATEVDQWDIENIANPAAHLSSVPANGTFLVASTGDLYRIAGGAPFLVSSWSVFGGEQPYVAIDGWDIEHIADQASHLNPTPADGTIVEALPSGTYWSFASGLRSQIAPAAGVTTVDDIGLKAFPQPAPPSLTPTSTPEAGSAPRGTPPAQQPSHGVLGTTTNNLPTKRTTSALSRALAKCRKIKNRHKRTTCMAAARRRSRRSKKNH